MTDNRQILAFFGHHKCATTWIHEILGQVCHELKRSFAIVNDHETFDHNLPGFLKEERVDVVAYVNADYEYVKQLESFKGFHVIRDPRDVCVSAYFSHLYSHPTDQWPELSEHRKKLEGLSKEDGLLGEMEFLNWEFKCMYQWDYSHPDILEIKMEELVENPYQYLLNVFDFLGVVDQDKFSLRKRAIYLFHKGLRAIESKSRGCLSIPMAFRRLPAERILGIIWENDFKRKTGGRQRGQEDPKSHYRRGVSGDWKNHLSEDHVDYFKEHYNHVLLKLGYEQSPDWK